MRLLRIWCGTFLMLIACTTGNRVIAGGWDRFDQGVDLLFDPGRLTVDVRLYDLIPHREFETVNGRPEHVSTTTSNVFRPSVNAKFIPVEQGACLAAYRQPFGLDNEYPSTWSQAGIIVSSSLLVQELGLTCSYRLAAGEGYVRLIGGATEDFAEYRQDALRALPNGAIIRPVIDLKGSAPGWRAGLAYEMPGKGVRTSIMYYSDIDFSVHGAFRQLPLRGNAFLGSAPITAAASLPRAVEGAVQFPIAPAWFNTLFVKWAEWSVLTTVPVVLAADAAPLRAGQVLSSLNTFWRDGWTVANTVTYRRSDRLGLSLRLAWDRGVSTGWTDNPEAWSTMFFANYSVSEHVEVTGGLGLIIGMPAELDKLAQGAMFNATAGLSYAVFTHLGFLARF